jgi:outer membrane receptor protein involved in Fe transport
MKLKLSAIVALALASSVSLGAAEKLTTDTINVYSATPLPSIGLPLNIIPSNIQIATPKAINNQAGVSLADYMTSNLQGVSTTEMGGNPWQPEVTFRGYSASPLVGMPQGISTYVDGVRMNEPFGDVTLWDKIPNFAIGSMQLIPGSNPMYGLNTLGGAIAIQTKSGREARGAAVEFEAGSWDRQRYLAEYGGVSKDGSVDYYIGHQTTKEDGWRQFSPSRLNQTFGKLGWQNEKTKLDLGFIGTDNKLTGNGFTPEFLLSGDRDQIHTQPDISNNYYKHLTLNGSHWVNNDVMISGNAYYRRSNRHTINGDLWEAEGKAGTTPYGAAASAVLAQARTWAMANPGAGGSGTSDYQADDIELKGSVMNRGHTRQDNYGFTLQSAFNQDFMGKKNQLIAGIGYDKSRIRYNQSEHVNISGESVIEMEDDRASSVARANVNVEYEDLTAFGTSGSVFDASRGVLLSGDGLQASRQSVNLRSKQQTMSLFATDTLSLNDKWHVNLGARYNHTKVQNDDILIPERTPTNGSLTADATYSRFNPTAGLTFTPNERISVFGSYSESNRAPTAIELGCSNPLNPCLLPNAMADDPPLKQVVARTIDFGAKGDLTDAIKFNASVYYARNSDDIQFLRAGSTGATDTATSFRNRGYFSNVGDTRRIGLDLGLNGKLDNFRWSASYAYVRATYEDDFQLVGLANSSAIYDGVSSGNRYRMNVSKGDSMPSIPKHQLKIRAQYDVTPDWTVGANAIGYTTQYVYGNENNDHRANTANCGTEGSSFVLPACESGKLAGYMIVNLDTQYNIGKGWKAFAKAINVFDQDYNVAGRLIDTSFNAQGAYGDESTTRGLIPGAPRAGWIGVRYEFGGAPEAK